jgi:hypothetical protein
MTIPTRLVPAVLVQFANNWPANDAGWSTAPTLIPQSAEALLGSQIGTAAILELSGYVAPPGVPGVKVGIPRSNILRVGKVVRIIAEDSAGTITQVINKKPKQFKAIWWGTVVGQSRDVPGGDVTESTYTSAIKTSWICEEAKGQLARSRVCYSYLKSNKISRVIPFNEGLGASANIGANRSSGTYTVDGQSVYTFDRGTTAARWKYKDAVDYLLASYGRAQAAGIDGKTEAESLNMGTGGLRWRVEWTGSPWTGADVASLPYLDPADQDVLSILNRIAGADRGLSWTYEIDGEEAVIRFISLTPSDISYGSTGLLQNVAEDLDHRQNRFILSMRYQADATGYDYIVVQGDRPLRHVTFAFPGDLIPDDSWTTSDPADDSATPDGLTGAWRSYRIATSWDGSGGAGGTATPYVRGKISGGDGLPSGVRSYQAAMPSDGLDLTTGLGIPAYYGTGTDRTGGEQGPVILACTTTNNTNKAEDFSDRMAVAVTSAPPGIVLGLSPGDSQTIKSWYDGRGTAPAFYVTVGVKEWAPLQVAWMRSRGSWPNGTPRVLCYRIPDATEVSRSNGVRMSVDTSGNVQGNASGETSFRDNTDTLKLTLALLRSRYEVQGGTVTWTERAKIDTTTELGTMIGTVWMPDSYETANAVISSIAWDFTSSTTSYATTRPDFQPNR